MKTTNKMRKLQNGMNAATIFAFKRGFRPPTYANVAPIGQIPSYKKVGNGTPYVNPKNFGM